MWKLAIRQDYTRMDFVFYDLGEALEFIEEFRKRTAYENVTEYLFTYEEGECVKNESV